MTIKSWFTSPFRFAPSQVSALAVLLYGGIFTAVLVTDQTPAVPSKQRGLSLHRAYEDLHIVSSLHSIFISY